VEVGRDSHDGEKKKKETRTSPSYGFIDESTSKPSGAPNHTTRHAVFPARI